MQTTWQPPVGRYFSAYAVPFFFCQAAAEEELRALEAAEELRRRALFSRLPSLPNFGDRLPQLESRFSEFRERLPKLRNSESSSGRKSGAVDVRKTEVFDALGKEKTSAEGQQGQKDEKTSALAIAAQLNRPAESVKGGMVRGRKGQETLLREQFENQVLGKEAVLAAKGEKALPAGKTGSGSHYELGDSETRPESLTEDKRGGGRRGFLRGLPVPGIFRRPRSASSKKDLGPSQGNAREAVTKDGKESTADPTTKEEEAERSKEQESGVAEKGKLRDRLGGFSGSRSSAKTGDITSREERQGTKSGKVEKGLGERVDIVTEEVGQDPESTASKRG
jgi:hypothetical protein